MRELSAIETEQVCGGNALDTTTGTYNTTPALEPGLSVVPLFGFIGPILLRLIF